MGSCLNTEETTPPSCPGQKPKVSDRTCTWGGEGEWMEGPTFINCSSRVWIQRGENKETGWEERTENKHRGWVPKISVPELRVLTDIGVHCLVQQQWWECSICTLWEGGRVLDRSKFEIKQKFSSLFIPSTFQVLKSYKIIQCLIFLLLAYQSKSISDISNPFCVLHGLYKYIWELIQ